MVMAAAALRDLGGRRAGKGGAGWEEGWKGGGRMGAGQEGGGGRMRAGQERGGQDEGRALLADAPAELGAELEKWLRGICANKGAGLQLAVSETRRPFPCLFRRNLLWPLIKTREP
jgi:hypothetical protein